MDDILIKINETQIQGAIRWQKRALEAEARVAELEGSCPKYKGKRVFQEQFDAVVWEHQQMQSRLDSINAEYEAEQRRKPASVLQLVPDQSGKGGSFCETPDRE